jgi:hypothetical protein
MSKEVTFSVTDPTPDGQLDLLDYAAQVEHGHVLAEQGMSRAEENAGPDDCQAIDQAIAHFARTDRPFSANDVRPHLPQVRRPAIGARFNAASRRGLIRPIGYTPSSDPGTHGHPIRLWIGATSTSSQ